MSLFLLVKATLQSLGAHGLGVSLLLGYGIERLTRGCSWPRTEGLVNALFFLGYGLLSVVALAYLAYPNYIDHVEPTLATLGLMLKAGQPLYPPLDSPTFHGLLYGPLLAQIQALFQWLSPDPIFNSKLPGVLALLAFFALAAHSLRSALARGTLLALLPFGLYLFWNRAEPFFLLACALAWWACRRPGLGGTALLGILCGLAFTLKLHGVLYIAPFVLIRVRELPWAGSAWRVHGTAFAAAGAATVLACFAGDSISVAGYAHYLMMATRHGLAGAMLHRNLVYGLGLAIPLWVGLRWRELPRAEALLVVAILCLEAVAVLLGSKPGAGTHHLMPFIFINACLLERLQGVHAQQRLERLKYAFLILGIYFLVIVAPSNLRKEARRYDFVQQPALRHELQELAKRYPDALMAYGSGEPLAYSHAFYRVLLQAKGSQQVDAAAYMDLAYSGLPDQPLADLLASCARGTLFVPRAGTPYSIKSYYTDQALFSDRVRTAFEQHYRLVEAGRFYDVYRCS